MQKIVAFFVIGLTSFGLGYFTSELTANHAQSNSAAILPNSADPQNLVNNVLVNSPVQQQEEKSIAENQIIVRQQQEQIHQLIEQASTEKVDEYLARTFPNANLQEIRDRKKFAQRMVDEFIQSKNDDRSDLRGKVIVTTQQQSPLQVSDLSSVHTQQLLFAHLDTLNSIENPQQVFIRWIDRDTGEVLLFTVQNVSKQNSKNWISFTPQQGWKVGTYDVRYYQMNDDLKPIAQTSFNIQSVYN